MDNEIQAPILGEDAHTISLYVANKPGVLVRISLVFARRGFNIESLVVSPALDGRFSRMTITARGDKKVLDQIIKQCAKLIDVVTATEHVDSASVERELALVKITTTDKNRSDLLKIIEHFEAKTVDFHQNHLVAQIVGVTEKLDSFVKMVERFGITEIVRTGKLLMTRGSEIT